MLSVVINSFRDTERVLRCLASVEASRGVELEIILVDYESPGLEERIRRDFPRVRLLSLDSDPGPSAQRNLGYEASRPESEAVVFLDNDTVIDPSCLSSLEDFLRADPHIGLVQPRILPLSDAPVESTGCYLDPLFFVHREHPKADLNDARTSKLLVSYAESAVLAMRRGILDAYPPELRSFDPTYFIQFEDVDLSLRTWLAGLEVAVLPSAKAYNEWRMTSGESGMPPERIRLNERNRLKTMIRIYSLGNLLRFLPLALVFELGKAFALLRADPRHARATLGGVLDVLINMGEIRRQRAIIQKRRRRSDAALLATFVPLDIQRLVRSYRFHYPDGETRAPRGA